MSLLSRPGGGGGIGGASGASIGGASHIYNLHVNGHVKHSSGHRGGGHGRRHPHPRHVSGAHPGPGHVSSRIRITSAAAASHHDSHSHNGGKKSTGGASSSSSSNGKNKQTKGGVPRAATFHAAAPRAHQDASAGAPSTMIGVRVSHFELDNAHVAVVVGSVPSQVPKITVEYHGNYAPSAPIQCQVGFAKAAGDVQWRDGFVTLRNDGTATFLMPHAPQDAATLVVRVRETPAAFEDAPWSTNMHVAWEWVAQESRGPLASSDMLAYLPSLTSNDVAEASWDDVAEEERLPPPPPPPPTPAPPAATPPPAQTAAEPQLPELLVAVAAHELWVAEGQPSLSNPGQAEEFRSRAEAALRAEVKELGSWEPLARGLGIPQEALRQSPFVAKPQQALSSYDSLPDLMSSSSPAAAAPPSQPSSPPLLSKPLDTIKDLVNSITSNGTAVNEKPSQSYDWNNTNVAHAETTYPTPAFNDYNWRSELRVDEDVMSSTSNAMDPKEAGASMRAALLQSLGGGVQPTPSASADSAIGTLIMDPFTNDTFAASVEHVTMSDGAAAALITAAVSHPRGITTWASDGHSPLSVRWSVASNEGGGQLRGRNPPPGWHTMPAASSDVGHDGQWETRMDYQGDNASAACVLVPVTTNENCVLLQLRHGDQGVSIAVDANGGNLVALPGDHTGAPGLYLTVPTTAMPTAPAPAPQQHQHAHSSGRKEHKEKKEKRRSGRKDDPPGARRETPLPSIDPSGPISEPHSFVLSEVPSMSNAPKVHHFQAHDVFQNHSVVTNDIGALSRGAATAHAGGVDGDFVHGTLGGQEGNASRSLMHRYNIYGDAAEGILGNGSASQMAALYASMRFFAQRQLTWNDNYNVKPREISTAQNGLIARLVRMACGEGAGDLRSYARLMMRTLGRGASNDAGQRIRDEILDVQKRSGAKGGMMEQWHQKLHNNSCPDDVVICGALLAMLESAERRMQASSSVSGTDDEDLACYYAHLEKNGLTLQRMESYDRGINDQPRFSRQQILESPLVDDLKAYMITLRNVHDGRDMLSCAMHIFGYEQDSCKGRGVRHDGVPGLKEDTGFYLDLCTALAPTLLKDDTSRQLFASGASLSYPGSLHGDVRVHYAALVACTGLRRRLVGHIENDGLNENERKDAIYMDLSLEGHVRSLVESTFLPRVSNQPDSVCNEEILGVPLMVLENLIMSECGGIGVSAGDLARVYERLANSREGVISGGSPHPYVEAVKCVDEANHLLGEMSANLYGSLQPSANAVAEAYGVSGDVASRVSEDASRMGLPPALGQYLTSMKGVLKKRAQSLA